MRGKETETSRPYIGSSWQADLKNRFNGWAVGYYHCAGDKPKTVCFHLNNLLSNQKFMLKFRKCVGCAPTFRDDEYEIAWQKEYSLGELGLYANCQETFFDVQELDLPEGMYIISIEGDALLGCGESERDMPASEHLFRGYYRVHGDPVWRSISNEQSLAYRMIYGDLTELQAIQSAGD